MVTPNPTHPYDHGDSGRYLPEPHHPPGRDPVGSSTRRTRVAHPRPGFIPEGDAPPFTHTQPGAHVHWMVINDHVSGTPRPFAANLTRAEIAVMLALAVIGVVMVGIPTWVITESLRLVTLMCLTAVAWICLLSVPVIVFGCRNPIEREQQDRRNLERSRSAARRDEPDGRSPKRRPGGRGAAEGGGAYRPLGNTRILLPLPVDDGEVAR